MELSLTRAPLRREIGAEPEGPLTTRLGRFRVPAWGSAMGHEDLFPPHQLNAGCVFRKETIAGRAANGGEAPIRR
jgi:hypothetical protein